MLILWGTDLGNGAPKVILDLRIANIAINKLKSVQGVNLL